MSNYVEKEQLVDSFLLRAGNNSDWEDIKSDIPTLSGWGLEILKEGLGGKAKTAVLEKYYICKDHRNLFSNYYSKKFNVGSSYCYRLHFFSKENVLIDDIQRHPDKCNEFYLGYSVIRPVFERCIGRTVIDPLKIWDKDLAGFCLSTKFKVRAAGADLEINGFPYMSQDTETTVCAHTCLWAVCRYLSQRYQIYREIYPYDFVNLTPETQGRKTPFRGMRYSDYSAILAGCGFHPVVSKIDTGNDVRNLYTNIESGIPVIASVGGHAIVLIGHTINLNKRIKPQIIDRLGFIDSFEFLQQFIVVDDNCFPYKLLGYKESPENYGKRYKQEKSIKDIITGVSPLPEKVFLSPERVRAKVELMLAEIVDKIGEIRKKPYIKRMFLANGSSFKRHKRVTGLENNDNAALWVANMRLPHFVWITEISTPEEYAEGKCFAEIVVDSTASEFSPDWWLYIRIGKEIKISGSDWTDFNTALRFKQYTNNLRKVDKNAKT